MTAARLTGMPAMAGITPVDLALFYDKNNLDIHIVAEDNDDLVTVAYDRSGTSWGAWSTIAQGAEPELISGYPYPRGTEAALNWRASESVGPFYGPQFLTYNQQIDTVGVDAFTLGEASVLDQLFDKVGVDAFALSEASLLIQELDKFATDSFTLSQETGVYQALQALLGTDAASLSGEVAEALLVELHLAGVDAATLAEVSALGITWAKIDLTGDAYKVRMPTTDGMQTRVDRFRARYDYRYVGLAVLCTETSPGVWSVTPHPGTLDLTADNTNAADYIFYGGSLTEVPDAALNAALQAAGYTVS